MQVKLYALEFLVCMKECVNEDAKEEKEDTA